MSDPIETLYAELETRDDPTTWLVLADALLDAGDPRGELVQLHHALQQGDSSVKERIDGFLQRHIEQLVGFRPPPGVHLDWSFGHVVGARMGRVSEMERVPVLRELLGHPGNRLLRRLLLEGPPGELVRNHFQGVLAPLVAGGIRAPSSLRSLQLGEGYGENPSYWVYGYFNECRLYDRLGDLWQAFPELRSLRIDLGAADLELGDIRAEHLRDFEWVAPFLAPRHLEPLVRARWPEIERLVIWTGAEVFVNVEEDLYLGADDPDDLEGLWEITSEDTLADAEDLEPVLRHLDTLPGLHTFGVANYVGSWAELASAARSHPFWERLVTLDLSHGRLREEEVGPLVSACRGAPALRRLVVEGLVLRETALAELRRGLPDVTLEGRSTTVAPAEQFFYVVTQE